SEEKVKFFNLGKARKKKLKEKNFPSLVGEEILKLVEVNYNQEVKEIIKTNPNSKVVLVNYPHNEQQFASLTTELAQMGKKINNIILLNIANFELILSLKNDYLICPLCERIYQKEEVLKENEKFVCSQDNECQFSFADIKKFSEYVIEYHLKNTEQIVKKFLSENKLTTSSIIQLTVQKKEEIFNGETQRSLLKVIESFGGVDKYIEYSDAKIWTIRKFGSSLEMTRGQAIADRLIREVNSQPPGKVEFEHRIEHRDSSPERSDYMLSVEDNKEVYTVYSEKLKQFMREIIVNK
ncbi:10157_t:CDS:2, partial [Funneliformis geosporum]